MTPATFRATREQLGYTREQLAGVLNVSVRNIKRWEQAGGAEPPAGVIDELLQLKDRQDFLVRESVQKVKSLINETEHLPKSVEVSYFKDQPQFDLFGRDEGFFNVANANSRAVALAVEQLRPSVEVVFNYPTEERGGDADSY